MSVTGVPVNAISVIFNYSTPFSLCDVENCICSLTVVYTEGVRNRLFHLVYKNNLEIEQNGQMLPNLMSFLKI